MDIEALAVAAVKAVIAKTDYLVDYIKDKDKEPMWDGSIYAYSSKSKRNIDWRGKASVQIKGKNIKTLNVSEVKYDLEVVNLKNYKKDGGLLFFVVGIDDEGNTKIFYRALTPYLINAILANKEKQETIRTEFFEFPIKKDDICSVVMNFIRDAKKQELFTHDNIPTLEDFLASAGKDISYEFQISKVGYNQNMPYKYLLGRELYMYAKNTKLDIQFPIEHIHKIEKMTHNVEGMVTIGDQVYYDKYEITHKVDGFEISIGQSILFDFNTAKETARVSYSLKGDIKEQIKDIQFITDLIEYRVARINGINFPVNPTAEELESFHIDEAKELQRNLTIIDNMLTQLGISKALSISNLTAKEEGYLRMLIQAFVEHKSIRFKEKNIPPVMGISIGNVYLLLHFRQLEDGSYHVENFPSVQCEVTGEYNDGEFFTTSKYVILKADDLIRSDNLSYKEMIDDIFLYENVGHFFYANLLLLEMLKAFDKINNEYLLNESTRLASWLKNADCLDGISTINYLQCIARQSELSPEQESELIEILEKYTDNEQMKAGIHILLGNKKMANICLEKLDENIRNVFYELPIYALIK